MYSIVIDYTGRLKILALESERLGLKSWLCDLSTVTLSGEVHYVLLFSFVKWG